LEALIPDPAIYKFETGTGYEIRPVLSPDGQSVVFNFDYMYTTDVREPVRADEKHLGRVRRHFIHTDVQLGNYELREVSKYQVAIKVARTARGVQLLQDIPGIGVLFRPLPSAGSSLQQNLIYAQSTIFPTLFDLMGLRYAPAVADLDPLGERLGEFSARYRRLDLEQRIFDIGATRVDDALRTPWGERRADLYRPQINLPVRHPNDYIGPGLRLRDGHLIEGYNPQMAYPETRHTPSISPESRPKPYNLYAPYPDPITSIPGVYPPGAPTFITPPPGLPPYPQPPKPSIPYPPPLMNPPIPPGTNGTNRYPPLPTYTNPPASNPLGRELPAIQQPPVITPGFRPAPTGPMTPMPTQPVRPPLPISPAPQSLPPATFPPATLPPVQPQPQPRPPATLPPIGRSPSGLHPTSGVMPLIPTLPAGLSTTPVRSPQPVPVPTLSPPPLPGR
ncbi:MAG: hypothetical protein L0241_18775, partial [Planctomycetia bacterium]|nr:hypothetical protein [Planctomycetia bacterium]